MIKSLFVVLLVVTLAQATGIKFIENLIVDMLTIREGVRGVSGNWEMAPMSVMPSGTDGTGFYLYGDEWGPRRCFFGMDGNGQTYLETPGSTNIFLMTKPDHSNTIYWGAMPVDEMPNTDWDYLIDHHQYSLYYDPEFNVLKLRDSTRVIFEIDEDVHLWEVEQYDFNVWHNFGAGTIEAWNGANVTDFVVAVGDTITVVGGIVLKMVHQ